MKAWEVRIPLSNESACLFRMVARGLRDQNNESACAVVVAWLCQDHLIWASVGDCRLLWVREDGRTHSVSPVEQTWLGQVTIHGSSIGVVRRSVNKTEYCFARMDFPSADMGARPCPLTKWDKLTAQGTVDAAMALANAALEAAERITWVCWLSVQIRWTKTFMRLDELQDCLGWEQAEFDGLYKEFCAIESNPSVDLFMAWMRAYGHLDLGTYTRIQDLGEVEVQELDELNFNSRHKDPHQVLAEVGHGAMGQVLLAREEDLGRRVAVKRLHEEDGGTINVDPLRFIRGSIEKLKLQLSLSIRASYPFIDCRTEKGELSYSMKLIHGDTMEHYLCDIIEAQSAGQKMEARYQLPARSVFTQGL